MTDFIIGYYASTLAQKLPAIQTTLFHYVVYNSVQNQFLLEDLFQLTVAINTEGMRELVIVVSFEMDLGCKLLVLVFTLLRYLWL